MSKITAINNIKQNFSIKELVCPHVYNKWGESTSWQFLSRELLETLFIIRTQILKVPIIINNWAKGGQFSQRGLRCNQCKLVKDATLRGTVYVSPHAQGKAIDFHTNEYTPEECRQMIIKNQMLLPYNIRLEKDVNWVHFDIYDKGTTQKITMFNG